jgi:hypothetical protein
MKQKPKLSIASLAPNGKLPLAVTFHRDGTISFRDGDGRWTHHLAALPARTWA